MDPSTSRYYYVPENFYADPWIFPNTDDILIVRDIKYPDMVYFELELYFEHRTGGRRVRVE